jgi:hypothetical protein
MLSYPYTSQKSRANIQIGEILLQSIAKLEKNEWSSVKVSSGVLTLGVIEVSNGFLNF